MSNMKAMLVKNEELILSEVEMPVAKVDEVLIEIKAIGINRADLLQRKGRIIWQSFCRL